MKLVIANHKMNLTLPEVLQYRAMIQAIDTSHVKLIICPSYPYFPYFQGTSYQLGSQNVGRIEQGSLTGEVSAKQLSFLHVKYVLVGHSERRNLLKEDSIEINQKVKQIVKVGMKAILCIGETLEHRQKGETLFFLKEKLQQNLEGLTLSELSRMVIAYEPIWAIGTGILPPMAEIKLITDWIKNWLKETYTIELKVLYGGSVNTKTIEQLEQSCQMDGYLIGGCSLIPNKLKEIIEKIQ